MAARARRGQRHYRSTTSNRASCDLSQRTYQGEIEISAAAYGRGGITVVRSDSSNRETRFTIVEKVSGGAGVGVGGEVVLGRSYGASASADAGVVAEMGDSWVVPTTQADVVADQLLRSQINEKVAGPLSGAVEWLASPFVDLDMRNPDIVFTAGGVEAGLQATALVHQVGGKGALVLGVEEDRRDGSRTTLVKSNVAVSADMLDISDGDRFGGSAGAEGIIRLKRDADDRLVEVEVESTVSTSEVLEMEGGLGQLVDARETSDTVRTMTIPLSSDADRQIVEDWERRGLNVLGLDSVKRLGQEKGQYRTLTYEGESQASGLGVRGELGPKVGVVGTGGRAERIVRSATYLSAPDGSGRRTELPFEECLAGGGG